MVSSSVDSAQCGADRLVVVALVAVAAAPAADRIEYVGVPPAEFDRIAADCIVIVYTDSESVVVAVESVGLGVQVGVSPTGTDLLVVVEEHNCPSDEHRSVVSPVGLGLGCSVLVPDAACILTEPAAVAVAVLAGTGHRRVVLVDVDVAVLVGIVEHDLLVGFDNVVVPVGAAAADIAVVPVNTEPVPVGDGTVVDRLLVVAVQAQLVLVAVLQMTVLPEQ